MSMPTSSTSPRQQASVGWLALLGMLTAVAPLSIDMYLPSFSTVERLLAATPGSMELTLACFFVGLTLGQLFYGPISDRFGRKPLLYAGFALYALASLGCAFSDSVPELNVWRFLQGMGGCVGIMIPSAMVRDRLAAPEAARAFSMLMLVMGLAPILAPLLGGWILTYVGWRAIFYVLAFFGLAGLLASVFLLKESLDASHVVPLKLGVVLANYARLLKDPVFVGFSLSGGLTMAGMFAYIAGSPFVLIELYEVAPANYGWYFGLNAVGLIASSQLNAQLLKRVSADRILRTALWVPLLVGLSLVGFHLLGMLSLRVFAVAFFLFVASIGWITPNATALALSAHGKMAGTAAALISALQFFFATLAGMAIGVLHDGTSLPLVIVMAACGCGAWGSHRLLLKKRAGPVADKE